MELIQTILVTLLTLFVVVTFHEFGHFWVARRCGVRVLRFSIGFGKPLYTWRDRSGTEFVLAPVPLGGYVKMYGEGEPEAGAEALSPEERRQAFNHQPVGKRIAIVAAGPIANFLLAIAIFWAVFAGGVTGVIPLIEHVERGSIAEVAGLAPGQEIVAVDGQETPTRQALNLRLLNRIGESGEIRFSVRYPDSDLVYESSAMLDDWLVGEDAPDLVAGLGLELYLPKVQPVLDVVVEDSPAARAGLRVGDRLLSADGQAIEDWSAWVDLIRARPEQSILVSLERDGAVLQVALTPARLVDAEGKVYGQVGVSPALPEWPPEMLRTFHYSPLEALGAAGQRTAELTAFTFDSLRKMLVGLISPKNLSGPITIAKVAAASANSGLDAYLSFLALLSISLGVLNLLPIPVLDGGHILYGLIELVRGKPLSERFQALGYQVGLVIIVGVMVLAVYNDIARL